MRLPWRKPAVPESIEFDVRFHVELRCPGFKPPIWGDLEPRPSCVFCGAESFVVAMAREMAQVACLNCDARGPKHRMPDSFLGSRVARLALGALAVWLRRRPSAPVQVHDMRSCPFCGHLDGLVTEITENERVRVMCQTCAAGGPSVGATRLLDNLDPRRTARAMWCGRAADQIFEHDDHEPTEDLA